MADGDSVGLADSDALPVFAVVTVVLLFSVAFLVFMLAQQRGSEPFSEVFFRLDSLPEKVNAGEDFSFAFAVNNHEGQSIKYDFEVLSEGKILEFGAFSVAPGGSKEKPVSIRLGAAGKQKVSVRVSYASGGKKEQEIFFWVEAV
ncbi:MAG: hypothetical protein HY394_05110 [Candidatus Diapherotrites archaeon]|nr:hypothetical protein [Candidatus Diapherotrites archaeon]